MKIEIPEYNLEIRSIVFKAGDSIPDIDFSCFDNLSNPSFLIRKEGLQQQVEENLKKGREIFLIFYLYPKTEEDKKIMLKIGNDLKNLKEDK